MSPSPSESFEQTNPRRRPLAALRVALILPTALLSLLGVGTVRAAAGTTGHLHFGAGVRSFGDAALDEVSDHASFGLHLSVRRTTWPVAILASYQSSDDDAASMPGEAPLSLDVTDLSVGVGRSFVRGEHFRPHVGAGLSYFDADLNVLDENDVALQFEDSDLGLFTQAGLTWRFGHFDVGMDMRLVIGPKVETRVDEELSHEVGLDSWKIGARFGFGW